MQTEFANERDVLYKKLIDLVNKNIPAEQAKLVTAFIEQYYATVSLESLEAFNLLDIYGALISHWHLLCHRQPNEVKLKVYNPEYEEEGWKSTHTVIEIVQDDMPFLVDSILIEMNRRAITTHMIIHVGGLKVMRNNENRITNILSQHSTSKECLSEAVIFMAIDRQIDEHAIKEIEISLQKVLRDVHLAVQDWSALTEKMHAIIQDLEKNPPPVDEAEIKESIDFLRWVVNEHFTFIGYREYDLVKKGTDFSLTSDVQTGLGVLRADPAKKNKPLIRDLSDMPEEARKLALSKDSVLIVAKTNTKSTIHRPAYTDYIGIKQFDKDGNIVGEHRFIGLYTSAAYNRSPRDIPFMRRKVREVMDKSRLSKSGHAGKALQNILENLPRDDLFQASSDELLELALGIFHIQERRMTRIFVRKDNYSRFISCLVYVPRDLYYTKLRVRIQELLLKTFNGMEITFTTWFSESALARIHYMIRVDPKVTIEYDIKLLEKKVSEISRTWEDDVADYLRENNGEAKANFLIGRYLKGFPAGYIEMNNPMTAVYDIAHVESITDDTCLAMNLFKPIDAPEGIIRFKLYTLDRPMPLSDVLPILENMGLRVLGEEPFRVQLSDGHMACISDFTMMHDKISEINIGKIKEVFQELFAKVWMDKVENDAFNKLSLIANLRYYEIIVIRAYSKYFRQIGYVYSQNYIEDTINKHSALAAKIIQYFILRFNPDENDSRDEKVEKLDKEILADLDKVTSLDEDKILRLYHDLIKATLRTNYFQRNADGSRKEYLSLKFESALIPDLPLPKPLYELFVYSPRVEGVRLYTQKVARGGLRWSDRREDYRSEVLGLVKAQKVKNAVIVPSGAKGGFVCKLLHGGEAEEDFMKEGIICYKTFIRGMLDLADNIVNDDVVSPSNTVCYDEQDCYLVVAADKGTANFSNYANDVAKEYNYWLGDAFASGGITGYNHKEMGITARGAWEAVKRHFRELNLNTQETPFTVIGIGDMRGDVFGNGMLLSKYIKLIVAFNNAHIFIDPNPDTAISYAERERLFNLPRSSWKDYNPSLISKGGGVFSRSDKSITLTPEIINMLETKKKEMAPNELLRNLLKVKADLFWNGGIGTFVKASTESNSDVADRNNDLIRINASELNVRVVGEGGNLGFTQLARIEYDSLGGYINTDFIDNSAGVDCSDHEVNIKILLNNVMQSQDLTEKQRNQLLADMTDEISSLVLKNNYQQTQSVSISKEQSYSNLDMYINLINHLEELGLFKRKIEFLPDEKELEKRKTEGVGLSSPEVCVLLAYSKIHLKDKILASDIPEDSYIAPIVKTEFPSQINDMFPDKVMNHSLLREIIATQTSNMVINEMGAVFIKRLQDETGSTVDSIVRAYFIVRKVFFIESLWREIEKLDYKIPSEVQIEMMTNVGRIVRRAVRWIISNHKDLSQIKNIVEMYREGVLYLYLNLGNLLLGTGKEFYEKVLQRYLRFDMPKDTALKVASSMTMFSALDIVSIANENQVTVHNVAKVYFMLSSSLEIGWLRAQIMMQRVSDQWESLAKAAFRDELDCQQREITVNVLRQYPDIDNTKVCVESWLLANESLVYRWRSILAALSNNNAANDFVMYVVAIRTLRDLTKTHLEVETKIMKKAVIFEKAKEEEKNDSS